MSNVWLKGKVRNEFNILGILDFSIIAVQKLPNNHIELHIDTNNKPAGRFKINLNNIDIKNSSHSFTKLVNILVKDNPYILSTIKDNFGSLIGVTFKAKSHIDKKLMSICQYE